MRVLWFTNIPMPAMDEQAGIPTRGSGWWMSSLLEHVRAVPGIELGVATASPCRSAADFQKDGVRYFVIPQSRWGLKFARVRAEADALRRCAQVVREFKPDLVHIHGSERFYGLLKANRLIDTPTLVSIQGLVGPYAPYVFGSLSPHELLATHGPLALLRGDCAWGAYREFMRQAPRERDIIASADAVAGRTDWDIAHSRAMAPQCRYFHVGELLRKPFHEARWALADCQRHSIMVTNARAPMRGFETVLDAVAVLRQSYPDIRVRLAAGIAGRYGSFLRRRIDRLGLSDRVELLGWLDGEQLAAALVKSHCYVMASHVENSPNSLCEAQLVGMPCVASYAGGISSLLEHGRTGLFFPVGDGAVLAHRLRTIFQDDSLAQRLGAAARAEAAQRHDPKRVVDELMQAYRAAAGARSD